MEIFSSSPAALRKNRGAKQKYPFDKLRIGQSFRVERDDVKEKSFRNVVSAAGKRLRMVFTVIKHDGFFEVARIG